MHFPCSFSYLEEGWLAVVIPYPSSIITFQLISISSSIFRYRMSAMCISNFFLPKPLDIYHLILQADWFMVFFFDIGWFCFCCCRWLLRLLLGFGMYFLNPADYQTIYAGWYFIFFASWELLVWIFLLCFHLF